MNRADLFEIERRVPVCDTMESVARAFLQFLLMAKAASGVEKHWLPDLEWETAENWVGKRIPELDSHVTFPLDMRHAAGIGRLKDLRISGIDLARSGILALPRNGRLQVIERAKIVKVTIERQQPSWNVGVVEKYQNCLFFYEIKL